jgi:hypothetical protein
MDIPMANFASTSPRRSGTSILRSYGTDVKTWASGIVRGYAVAVSVLLGGGVAVLTAAGFGVAALFRFIELRYGTDVALETLSGFFAIIGVVGVLIGIGLLKRQTPPLPRPHRQVEEFKRSVVASAALRLLPNDRRLTLVTRDPVTQLLIGAAAAFAIGWISASGLTRSSNAHRSKA